MGHHPQAALGVTQKLARYMHGRNWSTPSGRACRSPRCHSDSRPDALCRPLPAQKSSQDQADMSLLEGSSSHNMKPYISISIIEDARGSARDDEGLPYVVIAGEGGEDIDVRVCFSSVAIRAASRATSQALLCAGEKERQRAIRLSSVLTTTQNHRRPLPCSALHLLRLGFPSHCSATTT